MDLRGRGAEAQLAPPDAGIEHLTVLFDENGAGGDAQREKNLGPSAINLLTIRSLKDDLNSAQKLADDRIVTIIRYTLMTVSVLSAFSLLFFLAFSGHGNNILALAALAFLVVNIFYIFISRPTIKTSELLTRASAGLAIISFELQFRAQEAQNREVEAEKIRLTEHERTQYKLKIAKDMLQHISPRLQLDWKEEKESPRITHQLQLENGSVVPPVSLAVKSDQSTIDRAARENSPQSMHQQNLVSSSNIFN